MTWQIADTVGKLHPQEEYRCEKWRICWALLMPIHSDQASGAQALIESTAIFDHWPIFKPSHEFTHFTGLLEALINHILVPPYHRI